MSANPPGRASARCLEVMTNTTLVFPFVALVMSLLTFLNAGPTPFNVTVLAGALVPWAFVAGSVRVPPIVVVAAAVAAGGILVWHDNDQAALFLPIVAISWSGAIGARWPSRLGVIGGSATSIACMAMRDLPEAVPKAGWAIWSTGMLFGWFAGWMLHRQRQLTDELTSARHDLALAAVADERKQIAREVHDIVGHGLTVVLLNVTGARRHLATNPAASSEALERAEQVARESLDTVRSVVGLLSSGSERQTDAPLPGGADVLPVVERARSSGLPVELVVVGDPASLPPAVGLTVVRVLQEALSNASRHAPGARIDVRLDLSDVLATLEVANDLPAGFVAARVGGHGLSGMSDRVRAVGGGIDVGPRDGRWVVRALLPRIVCVEDPADAGARGRAARP